MVEVVKGVEGIPWAADLLACKTIYFENSPFHEITFFVSRQFTHFRLLDQNFSEGHKIGLLGWESGDGDAIAVLHHDHPLQVFSSVQVQS